MRFFWTEDLLKGKLFTLARNREEAAQILAHKAGHQGDDVRQNDEPLRETDHVIWSDAEKNEN